MKKLEKVLLTILCMVVFNVMFTTTVKAQTMNWSEVCDVTESDVTSTSKQPFLVSDDNGMYIAWAQSNGSNTAIRVMMFNGTTWGYIDGAGLSYDSEKNATNPYLIIYEDTLYIAWEEQLETAFYCTIHVMKYNGGNSWSAVDGGENSGISCDKGQSSGNVFLMEHSGSLYAAWDETVYLNANSIPQLHVKRYLGGQSWEFVDNTLNSGINYDTYSNAATPVLISYDDKLYAAWQELNAGKIYQFRVKCYDGSGWSAVDGGAGINHDSSKITETPKLFVIQNTLYAAWYENKAALIIKKYNGDNTWTKVDSDMDTSFHKMDMVTYNDKLYLSWIHRTNSANISTRVFGFDATSYTSLDNDTGINTNLVSTSNPPTLAVYNKTLYTAWMEGSTIKIKGMKLPNSQIITSTGLTEDNLDLASLNLTLNETSFKDSILEKGNFTLINAPFGLSIENIIYTSPNQCTIDLAYEGTDFDSPMDGLSVIVSTNEIMDWTNLTDTNAMQIIAIDDPESIMITDDGIWEGEEDGKEIIVSISGGTFANTISSSNWTVDNLPAGVAKGTVVKVDAHTVRITLSGNATVDYGTDITNVSVSCPVTDYVDSTGGAALTANTGVTLRAYAATLERITITTPATKLTYTVGDSLDLSGMVVTGTYSDTTTKTETITAANISGFDSSVPAAGQILTVTVDGKTITYTVTINAAPSNHAPTAKSTVPTQSMTVGSNASFTAADIAEDEDGDALTVTDIVTVPDSTYVTASLNGGAVTITGVATGSTSITVSISDGNGGTVDVTVPIEVTAAAEVEISITQSPIKTILNAITFGLFFDDTIDVSISCMDIVDHYEYQTVADGDTFDENSIWTQDDSFSIVPDFKGMIYARSVYGNGTTSACTVRTLVVDKTKPTISASYNVSSGSIEVSVTDSGAGIEKITYQVGTDAEQTINLEPSAILDITTQHSFTINSLPDGNYNVVINASDNSGNPAATKMVPVDYGGMAPTINTNSLDDGVVGTSYSQMLVATGASISWSVYSGDLPNGLTLNANTGRISGTPTTAGVFDFTVKAENSDGDDTKVLSIEISTVTPSGTAPTIITNSLSGGTVGSPYSQALAATGDTPITWSIIGDLPNDLTLNGSTISGTPTTRGTFSFIVKATNSDGNDTKALSIYISPASSGNDGGNNDGGSSGSSSSTTPTIVPDKKPDQPVIAASPLTPAVDVNGKATITVPLQTVVENMNKAIAEAARQGRLANGIGVSLEMQNPACTKSLGIVLTQPVLKLLTDSKVRRFEVDGGLSTLDFNLEALNQIRTQSTGDVTVTIAPVTGLSEEAKTLIGTRTVYNITLSYVKDGKTVNITSLNKGSVTLTIPYTPGKNEAVGYLFGVYVDGNDKVTRIDSSTYDANSKSVIFDSNHFSVYGVGFTAPSAKITDISTHWGKESIDYVVGRGLLVRTSDTTFSPDTAMTRGMLVTALGRLAGVDTKVYTTNSFTDVNVDSAYRPYIEWAYKKGIIQGIGSNQFAPDRAITREEIAVIIANFAKATSYTLPVTREATTYADASSIGSTYKTEVTAMQQAGIISGKGNGYFDPKGSVTRAEVATMLHRYIKLTIDPTTAQGWALNDDGQRMYYRDGKALTGWQTIDGKVYCFDSKGGAYAKGWKQDDKGNWYYFWTDGAITG
ncbi:MAG: S-layer homology domain-containing protein [Anaerocolumna sp.]